MARIERFEDLKAWQQARRLTAEVYRSAKRTPLRSDWGLRDRVQRGAVSVMSNIAEGFERMHPQEKLQFYNIARSSCGEVRSLTYICEDADLVPLEFIQSLRGQCETTGRLLPGLMHSFQIRRAR